MADLSLATDDELIQALSARFEHVVIMGRRRHEHDAAASYEVWHFKGDPRLCQGLGHGLIAKLETHHQQSSAAED